MGTDESLNLYTDTNIEVGKDSEYQKAELVSCNVSTSTSESSSNTLTVRSSLKAGSISIRTIPTPDKSVVNDDLTA